MIKNLEEAATSVLSSRYEVESFNISGNNITVTVKSRSGKQTWDGYIDFNDDGTFTTTNFMGSSALSSWAYDIAALLEIE